MFLFDREGIAMTLLSDGIKAGIARHHATQDAIDAARYRRLRAAALGGNPAQWQMDEFDYQVDEGALDAQAGEE